MIRSPGRRGAALLGIAVVVGLSLGGPSFAQPATDPAAGQTQAVPPSDGVPAQPAEAASPPSAPQPSPAPTSEPNASALPHDLSPWAMFRNADIVVKAVMVGLAFASLVTWTVFLAKRLQLTAARFRAVRAVRRLLQAQSLAELDQASHKGPLASGPVAALVHAAAHERERSDNLPADGIKERTAIALARVEARTARVMTRGTGLVATIGSTAPFVGLFGTVWGIMNAFVGISHAHSTNLAVVAPGIAEALLATAIGLVAAIPAVVIYNGLARATAGYKAILSDASAEVMRHLSRDLDRRLHPAE